MPKDICDIALTRAYADRFVIHNIFWLGACLENPPDELLELLFESSDKDIDDALPGFSDFLKSWVEDEVDAEMEDYEGSDELRKSVYKDTQDEFIGKINWSARADILTEFCSNQEEKKLGFIFSVHTAVPTFTSDDGSSWQASWGHAYFQWMYADTNKEIIEKASEWSCSMFDAAKVRQGKWVSYESKQHNRNRASS